MKLDKNYKVRVTPEQSREIQELVFGLGGKWNGGTDWVINEIIPFLYITSGLVMTCDSKAQEYFSYASSENTEILATELIAKLEQLTKNDKTMKLDDFLKCKKVRCANNGGLGHLTEGKEYEIKSIDYISVSDNDGDSVCVDADWFAPVLDSSENPLQNMKLTPEFEAVEPVLADNRQVNTQDNSVNTQDNSANIQDTPKFRVGDPVYCPLQTKELCKVFSNDQEFQPQCPLTITEVRSRHSGVSGAVVACVDDYGYSDEYDNAPFIFHATPENHALLSKLYPHIEFELPPLTGNELCRKLLDKGEKYIMAKDDTDTWRIICDYCDDWFTDAVSGKCLKSVTPINSKGEPLTQAVLDE